jgi:AraC family transcriptional regulator
MALKLAPGSFLGETIRSSVVSGFTFAESAYSPGARLPQHAHENAFFYLVLHGTCAESYGTRQRVSEPSTLVFHPAGETHSDCWREGGHCFHVEVSPALVERVRSCSPVLDRPTEFRGGLPVWIATRLYQELCRNDDLSPLAMEGLALELLVEGARRPATGRHHPPPHWLLQVRELIHERFAESLSLRDLAATVGVHPSHLARGFRQRFHCTIGEYTRKLRVDWSCRELSATDTPLVHLALAAGFTDQSHFSKTFKRLTGMSPAVYRMQFRSRNADTQPGDPDTRQPGDAEVESP